MSRAMDGNHEGSPCWYCPCPKCAGQAERTGVAERTLRNHLGDWVKRQKRNNKNERAGETEQAVMEGLRSFLALKPREREGHDFHKTNFAGLRPKRTYNKMAPPAAAALAAETGAAPSTSKPNPKLSKTDSL